MIRLALPASLVQLLSTNGSDIKLRHDYGHRLQLSNAELLLHPSLLAELFRPGIVYVNGVLNDCVVKHSTERDVQLKTAFLAGHFADWPFLARQLELVCTAVRCVSPTDGRCAVVKGAVIYGHDPHL